MAEYELLLTPERSRDRAFTIEAEYAAEPCVYQMMSPHETPLSPRAAKECETSLIEAEYSAEPTVFQMTPPGTPEKLRKSLFSSGSLWKSPGSPEESPRRDFCESPRRSPRKSWCGGSARDEALGKLQDGFFSAAHLLQDLGSGKMQAEKAWNCCVKWEKLRAAKEKAEWIPATVVKVGRRSLGSDNHQRVYAGFEDDVHTEALRSEDEGSKEVNISSTLAFCQERFSGMMNGKRYKHRQSWPQRDIEVSKRGRGRTGHRGSVEIEPALDFKALEEAVRRKNREVSFRVFADWRSVAKASSLTRRRLEFGDA
uniref:Uncharacterized protein n=1 Tax=Noctiluca scintillans TaxID=2966 RepID=A0A7S0ZSJ7_NOCSC|mmetsp:Transcript_16910/g.45825  ORF Transcript_16910/g.45825 Transcript_16910/m.45825 type:complete len:312 (+) Transcript_16910:57-992(+)